MLGLIGLEQRFTDTIFAPALGQNRDREVGRGGTRALLTACRNYGRLRHEC
jgi:hypothetical protein